MFIVLEGADCSGKTTQAKMLVDKLRATAGCEILHIACPTQSPAGCAARVCLKQDANWKSISNDPLIPAILLQSAMAADRYSVVGAIQECLRSGGIVIADRWTQSGLVYSAESGLDTSWITAMQSSLPTADLTIILDVDIETLISRLKTRDVSEIYETRSFQERILKRYRALGQILSSSQPKLWRVINGAQEQAFVHARIFEAVLTRRRDFV
jgi:dTMP kinase